MLGELGAYAYRLSVMKLATHDLERILWEIEEWVSLRGIYEITKPKSQEEEETQDRLYIGIHPSSIKIFRTPIISPYVICTNTTSLAEGSESTGLES